MNHKKIARTRAVAVVMGLYVLVFLNIQNRSESTVSADEGKWERLKKEQAARLSDWSSKEKIPLERLLEWKDEIARYKSNERMKAPPGTDAVPEEEIDASTRKKLNEAVNGLLVAYALNSPDLFIKYMHQRGEKLKPKTIEFFKKTLAQHGRSIDANDDADSESELIKAFWDLADLDAGWSAILTKSGSIQFWSTNKTPSPEIRQALGAGNSKIFQNISNYTHSFEPAYTLQDQLSDSKELLFADVFSVIVLGEEKHDEFVLYFIRFWYDSKNQIWHPYQLRYVSTGRQGGNVRHFF